MESVSSMLLKPRDVRCLLHGALLTEISECGAKMESKVLDAVGDAVDRKMRELGGLDRKKMFDFAMLSEVVYRLVEDLRARGINIPLKSEIETAKGVIGGYVGIKETSKLWPEINSRLLQGNCQRDGD